MASDLPELVPSPNAMRCVLVDEAHGGHFGFDSSLPVSALPLALIWWYPVHKSWAAWGRARHCTAKVQP